MAPRMSPNPLFTGTIVWSSPRARTLGCARSLMAHFAA
jgi:hypothetical protein